MTTAMLKTKTDTQKTNNGRRFLRNDLLFVFGILALVLIAAALMLFTSKNGDTVTVTLDGKTVGTYPLGKNTETVIRSGENGSGHNTLVIENGEAYVRDASCPDGICSAHAPISKDGESIICLPNKVVVTVNLESPSSPDIIQ